MATDIGAHLARLDARLKRLERGSRLAAASIEDTAVQVYDATGSLRAILGQQSDGTSGVNVVNGGPPPTPTTPTAASALGGIAVGWDGAFAAGAAMPLDWSRIEVHASTTTGFTPSADTLQATIETPQGAISYLPATGPTYVRLLARNTSGAASDPTAQAGPYSPRPVAGEIGIGEIVSTMISDGAVTTPKLFANAVTTPKLDVGSVDAVALKADAITGKTITGGNINGTTVTGGLIQTAASGERITLNESAGNKVLVYNSSGVAIGELSAQGLLAKGSSGAVIWMNPNATYPGLYFYNAAGTHAAVIEVTEPVTGDANLEMLSGPFSGSGYTNVRWRSYMSRDAAVIERYNQAGTNPKIGGRLFLNDTYSNLGYINDDNTAQSTGLTIAANLATLGSGRLSVLPPASANSGLYVEAVTAHTGNLLRLYRDADKFTVDKDGNTAVAGTLTAGNMATGSVSITPSAANTPTSALVTFSVTGTTVRGYATASTTVPGSRVNAVPSAAGVTGVSVSSVTNTSMLVWVNRENTTSTTVNWQVIGS